MNKLLLIFTGALVVGGGIYIAILNHRLSVLEEEKDKAFKDRATELSLPQATLNTPRELERKVTFPNINVISQLRKTDKGAKPVEVVDTTAKIVSKVETDRATSNVDFWHDSHHRFELNLKTFDFKRSQEFRLQSVVVESTKGTKVLTQDFQELDPTTHQPITDEEKPVLTTSYSVVQERTLPNVFHPRAVAGIGYLGQVGGGVEFLNLEKFGGVWSHANVSVLGLYNIKTKKAQGAVVLGIRPFNWNLSVGPAYFFPGNAFGAAATLELTR